MKIAAMLLATLVAGAAPVARRDAVPPAVPAGPALSCVPITQLHQSVVRSDRVIDFVGPGRRGYRVTLPHACPDLGFERRFAYETSLGELCSTDIITVLHEAPMMRGASCGLGPFQPVTFPAR